MVDYEIVRNPDQAVWKAIADMTYETEKWLISYEDYHTWLEGFGGKNFIFFAAIKKDTEEVIGSIALAEFEYESRSGKRTRIMTVGMYYVKQCYRGAGIGRELFDELMKEGKKRQGELTLNAVQKMSPKYAKAYGFDKFNTWHPKTYRIAISDVHPSNLTANKQLKLVTQDEIDFEKLLDYDKAVTSAVRKGYLSSFLKAKGSTHRIALKCEQIVGIVNVREAVGKNLCVGPFYAENEVVAEQILRGILETINDLNSYTSLNFFPPTMNNAAVRILEKLANGNIEDRGHMTSQFTHAVIKTEMEKIFSITEYAMSYA